MSSFSLTASSLSTHARKKKHPMWISAITRVLEVFSHAEDPYDIKINGSCDIATRPPTYVPYGDTSVMLHDSYTEIVDVEIELICWSSDPHSEVLALRTVEPENLKALNSLVSSYLDDNPDEVSKEDYN
jgi:hypothetical protein